MDFFLSWMSLRLNVKADHKEYFLYSWGHSLRHSSHMTQKKNVLTGIVSSKNLFLCSQNALFHALLVLLSLKKAILIMNKKSAASFNIS